MTQKIKFIIQDTIIDLSKPSYTVSQNTEGTRDKANITGINDHQNLIENNRPVLFKKARIKDRKIPEDIWGEVLAYWIGSQLSIPIARAYIAKKDGEFGCISEYVFCDQRYSMHIARETLIKHKSDYDFKSSKDHSIELIQQSFENIKIEDFNDSFTQMILFDLLIGNTDRHQDN